MKPLASWAAHLRTVGALSVMGGAVCGAATTSRSVAAMLAFLLAAVIYGGLMYVLSVRPQLVKAVATARELPHATREAGWVTNRRLVLHGLVAAFAFAGLVFLLGDLSLVGGIIFGGGVSFVLAARWVRHWERERGLELLVEPGWFGRRKIRRPGGWGSWGEPSAGAASHKSDFYIAPPGRSS